MWYTASGPNHIADGSAVSWLYATGGGYYDSDAQAAIWGDRVDPQAEAYEAYWNSNPTQSYTLPSSAPTIVDGMATIGPFTLTYTENDYFGGVTEITASCGEVTDISSTRGTTTFFVKNVPADNLQSRHKLFGFF